MTNTVVWPTLGPVHIHSLYFPQSIPCARFNCMPLPEFVATIRQNINVLDREWYRSSLLLLSLRKVSRHACVLPVTNFAVTHRLQRKHQQQQHHHHPHLKQVKFSLWWVPCCEHWEITSLWQTLLCHRLQRTHHHHWQQQQQHRLYKVKLNLWWVAVPFLGTIRS